MENPKKEEEGRLEESEGIEDTRRAWPIESTKWVTYGFTEIKAANTRPARV